MAKATKLQKGDKIGNFTYVKDVEPDYSGVKIRKPCRRVRVSCDFCGTLKDYRLSKISSGAMKSCGCQQYKNVKAKHGHARRGKASPEYNSWSSIFDRVYNKGNKQYHDYGGRGITICDRWNTHKGGSFENFLEDMGPKPSKGYTLDRIDVNGDYEPNNCRWADWNTQSKNKRFHPNSYGMRGVYWRRDTLKWCAEIQEKGKNKKSKSFVHLKDALKARIMWEGEYGGYNGIDYDYESLCELISDRHPNIPENSYRGEPEQRIRYLALRKRSGVGRGVELKGVYHDTSNGLWRSVFPMPDDSRVELGTFKTKQEAEQAVKSFTDGLTTDQLLRK